MHGHRGYHFSWKWLQVQEIELCNNTRGVGGNSSYSIGIPSEYNMLPSNFQLNIHQFLSCNSLPRYQANDSVSCPGLHSLQSKLSKCIKSVRALLMRLDRFMQIDRKWPNNSWNSSGGCDVFTVGMRLERMHLDMYSTSCCRSIYQPASPRIIHFSSDRLLGLGVSPTRVSRNLVLFPCCFGVVWRLMIFSGRLAPTHSLISNSVIT